jgi:hypothetical protein
MRRLLIAWLIGGCLAAGSAARAQTPEAARQTQGSLASAAGSRAAPARTAADPNKFAVIISGASGEEAYAKQFAQWTKSLRGALVGRLGFAEDRLTILTETADGGAGPRATADDVRRAFASLRGRVGPDSTVFIFLIGHGTFDGRAAKFNLVGPDLAVGEYGSLVGGLTARRVVVFQMASASGEFVKPLLGPGRIVVTATRSGQERNATRFAGHLIAALDSREADADQNGRVSVQEAFDYAARMTAEDYKRAGRLATEHPVIDDGGGGSLARTTYFDSLTAEQAAASAEVARLLRERERYETEIEQLKSRKSQMGESEYESELERLFVGLAKVNRSIKRGAQ